MLPRSQRLRLQRDITTVQRRGRSIGNRHFFVKFVPSSRNISRATVVVSLKVAKKAVVRNKIKRQVRAVLHKTLASIKKPHDIMIIVKRSALDLPFTEIEATIQSLVKKI